MVKSAQIHHKIRGSYPGFIGIELPDDYQVILMDEDNFNAYRRDDDFQAHEVKVVQQYCHFQKPVEGSWYIVISGERTYFEPERINIIYKSLSPSLSTSSSKPIWPTASTTQPAAFMS